MASMRGAFDGRRVAETRVVLSVAVALTLVAAGCAAPRPAGTSPDRADAGRADTIQASVTVCVVGDDGPVDAAARIEADGDTVFDTPGVPVPWGDHARRTGEYAEGRDWYVHGDDIPLRPSAWPWPEALKEVGDTLYVSYHRFIPSVASPDEIVLTPDSLRRNDTRFVQVTVYEDVPVFAEERYVSAEVPVPEVVYIPVRPGCVFMTYQQWVAR